MRGNTAMMAGAAAIAMMTAGVDGAHAQSAPNNAQLQAQIDALQAELQQSEMRQAQANDKAAASAVSLAGWWNNTSVSGRMYYDISNIEQKTGGVKQATDGTGFDIKRFYIGVDHTFDEVFSANVTTDFLYDSTAGATQLYIKKAYLQAKLSDAVIFRVGSTDLPWIPFMEGIYGYRYVENTLIDRTKFGTSADWGAHVMGKFADGLVNYQLSVVDGAGYKHPFHSDSMDFEGRVNLNYEGFILGLGGYSGKLGKDVEGAAPTHHTADRFDAVAAYTNNGIRVGVEYFSANNWNNVTTVAQDKASGWSPFASYQFDPQWGVFGRYDWVKPNDDTKPNLKEVYYNFGISYEPFKNVDFALVYKHDNANNPGGISTSNGTIGSAKAAGTYDEVGLWGQFQW